MNEIEKMMEAQRMLDAIIPAANLADPSKTSFDQPWSPSLVAFLCVGVLVFALLLVALATILLMRTTVPAHYVIRLFGIISIITFSAFLLVVGYSNEQLTPIIGLFGAIAGYLLGKEASPAIVGRASELVK